MELETWEAVPTFEGTYQVSTLGRIRSVDRHYEDSAGKMRTFHGHILKIDYSTYAGGSYTFIRTEKGNNYHVSIPIDRLVLAVFGSDAIVSNYIIHIDNDITNCALPNLKNDLSTVADLPNELWADIAGFEDYQVSTCGRIKKHSQTWNDRYMGFSRYLPERIIALGVDKASKYSKYDRYDVGLSKDGKPYYFRVSRLVAKAFIPNPNNLPQVNHIDGNPSNNCVDNLEWCTQSENMHHAFQTGLNYTPPERIKKMSMSHAVHVRCIETQVVYESIHAAALAFDVSDIVIQYLVNGKTKSSKKCKYTFERMEE